MTLKSTLKAIKLNESFISTILGVIVVVVVGILIVNYFGGKNEGSTIPPIDIEEISLPTSHTVSEGEDLWSISEKYYGSGYNWTDIAQENNLKTPSQIEVGQELVIPDVEPKLATKSVSPSPTLAQDKKEATAIDGEVTYVVQANDSLWTIAQHFYNSGYNWVDIAQKNNIVSPNYIEVGQKLVIPETEAKEATVDVAESILEAASDTNHQEAISGATYIVQTGDCLWDIAVRAYGDGYRWVDIAKESDLANPNLIHSGNKLTLPR